MKYYARIKGKNIRAALAEVEKQRAVLRSAKPATKAGKILRVELDLAARMAAESCHIMVWQQALAAGMVDRIDTLQTIAIKLAAGRVRIATARAQDDWNLPSIQERGRERAAALKALAEN